MMVFNKPIISKIETYIQTDSNGNSYVRARVTNPNTDSRTILQNTFIIMLRIILLLIVFLVLVKSFVYMIDIKILLMLIFIYMMLLKKYFQILIKLVLI